MMSFLHLGASLYVPCTRSDLAAIGNQVKFPALRSVIFCTEDAVRADDLPHALLNLEAALRRFEPTSLLRFVRVRNAAVLRRVVQMDGVEQLTGFVLPKATRHNLDEYLDILDDPCTPGPAFRSGAAGVSNFFAVMPTLETMEVFDASEMTALRDLLREDRIRRRILTLRIGGNDLLQHLGLRRPRGRSIYSTPLGTLIAQLALAFRPHGFNLTGPVVEWLDRPAALARETRHDLAHGLFGKSAIHPDQVPLIEAQYRVSRRDLQAAEQILAADAPSVFRLHDAMCEPTTHRGWARLICERERLYGVLARSADVAPHESILARVRERH